MRKPRSTCASSPTGYCRYCSATPPSSAAACRRARACPPPRPRRICSRRRDWVIRTDISGGSIRPGEAYLSDTPVLRGHAGTQPDLLLRWNEVPVSAEAVDVAVHLHGFSQQGGAMPLAEKVARSGLDLSGRTRPTLAILPRGNWIRHTWYDFPALLAGGLDDLVDYALQRFPELIAAKSSLSADRFILTAHSGGGMPAVDALAGARRPPDELHVFDG